MLHFAAHCLMLSEKKREEKKLKQKSRVKMTDEGMKDYALTNSVS